MSANEVSGGAEALKQFRAATTDICDVIPLTAEDDFDISSQVLPLAIGAGRAVFVESVATGLRYDRTPSHIARGGLDHYHIVRCIDGEVEFSSGRRALTLRPGDIWLIDMGQPNQTTLIEGVAGRCHLRALILPRLFLAPQLAFPDSATASLLSRSGQTSQVQTSQVQTAQVQTSQVLAQHLAALWQAAVNQDGDAGAAFSAVVDCVAGTVGGTAQTEGTVERADRPLFLAMIKRFIDTQLETEALSAADLCRRFGVSRASLYRMFAVEGGLARYVQEQRLNIAMRRLVSPTARHSRLIDLAVDLQFSSDSTFVRAFRRKFGVTLGEIREKSDAWLREGALPPAPNDVLHKLSKR